MNIENLILSNIIYNEEFFRKTLPYIKEDYFSGLEQVVFKLLKNYIDKYNSVPTKQSLFIDLSNLENLNENQFSQANELIHSLKKEPIDLAWLLDNTEKFCKEKAMYKGLMDSLSIMKGDDKQTPEAIPKILTDALAVSFDNSIGHDFIDDAEARYESYHALENRVPFDIDILNKITGGGLPNKTLNIILAPTGVGKSLIMCHMAAQNLLIGKNVLYITLELSEEKVAERIDANLLDISLDELKIIPKEFFLKKIKRLKSKITGKVIVKEYPTACAGSANFRHLINELKLKKNFVPDIIYIDYLNICMSSRIKFSNNIQSYGYIKAIAEELRGLAVEFNLPIVSATQTNRGGMSNSDLNLEDTSESVGLPMTADWYVAVTTDEDLDKLGQYLWKQLKSRYGDINRNKKFIIGVDKSKMRLFNVDQNENEQSHEDVPVMDNSPFFLEENERTSSTFDKGRFEGFR